MTAEGSCPWSTLNAHPLSWGLLYTQAFSKGLISQKRGFYKSTVCGIYICLKGFFSKLKPFSFWISSIFTQFKNQNNMKRYMLPSLTSILITSHLKPPIPFVETLGVSAYPPSLLLQIEGHVVFASCPFTWKMAYARLHCCSLLI